MTRKTPGFAYTRGAIAARVMLSSLIAVPIANLVLGVSMRLSALGSAGHPDQWWDVARLLISALVPGTFLGILLVLPLIAFAVGLGLVFRDSIARHLLSWCFTTPFILWPVASALVALVPGSPGTYRERFTEILFGSWGVFLLLAFIPGAVAFYALSRRAERRWEASMV